MDNFTPENPNPENQETPKRENPEALESQKQEAQLPESHETEEEIKEITDGRDIEIEEAWAEALHMEYDPEEARKRAEKAATPPPAIPRPPVQPVAPPPLPPTPNPYNQAPQPFGSAPVQNPVNPAPYQGHPEPMPKTFLVWSVLATVLCCFIPGIVAIVYSSMVSSKYYAKDYEGARRCSQMAEIWIIVSIVLGVVTAAVYIPISLLV